MPVNLPPEAQSAWDRYLEAKGTSEKIAALEEFLSKCPHHKGAQKMLANAKTKLSKLKAQLESEKKARKGTGEKWIIPKEDDGQIVLLGIPNSGKSAFLNCICGSEAALVADWPFSTIKPEVGALDVGGARVQLVELPGIVEGSSRGISSGLRVLASVRNTDGVLVIIDLARDPVEQFELILSELEAANLRLNAPEPGVTLERTGSGGKQIFRGDLFEEGVDGVIRILEARRFINIIVRFKREVSLEEFIDCLDSRIVRKNAMIVGTKGDSPGSKANFQKFAEYLEKTFSNRFAICPTSTATRHGISELPELIFQLLNRIRIFTQSDDGRVSEKPIVISPSSIF
ncbi:MAG: GTPase [Candidatus Hodarchaeota archaeon]